MLTEADVCRNYVTPSIFQAGWDNNRIKEQFYFTDGRINIGKNSSSRKAGKKADYILFYKSHLPLAVIEAKDDSHSHFDGMGQALDYARTLDIPFAYSTNGKMYLEHDLTTGEEREIAMDELPRPQELYQRFVKHKGYSKEQENVVLQNLYTELGANEPRYYQRIAINRTSEAILNGQNRIMLVMATGTGKTFTAFHIIHKLWKSGLKKRILFLADRNILVDQTISGDFAPFGDKMVKITGKSQIDQLKSYEIFLSLYQAMTGQKDFDDDTTTEQLTQDLYKQFSPDFFDLIVIDECHRGSAKEDSSWRDILNYFSSATHLGMTATPKNNVDVSNYEYFGEPVYTYSLKQGIDDGFLAPYRVINYTLDIDAEGYRPDKGKVDKYGNLIEDRLYNTSDYDRNIVIEERTKLIAKEVSNYLKATDRYARTIIFCQDTQHAAMMRSYLQTENSDMDNPRYVVRITGNEYKSDLEQNLYDFTDPNKEYPVIATTSKLLTTGVDTKTVKVIVLDANIKSLSEFKQIIGRGTRIREDAGKTFFTIIDFRKVTNLFADPDFDGEADAQVVVSGGEEVNMLEIAEELDEQTDSQESPLPLGEGQGEGINQVDWDSTWQLKEKKPKYYVDGVGVNVISKRTQVIDEEGKLVNLELTAKQNLKDVYGSMDEFIQDWNSEAKRKVIIDELREKGVFLHEIYEEYFKKYKQDIDYFDLILHLAFDRPPLTRKERAEGVQKRDIFGKYEGKAKEVLQNLLEKYADNGIEELENINALELPPINSYGTPMEIVELFGGVGEYKKAIQELEREIYKG
jgi:type I restriction enzyme, R subunit